MTRDGPSTGPPGSRAGPLTNFKRGVKSALWKLCLFLSLAGIFFPQKVHAAASGRADLDLEVTFNGQLSVSVDGLNYSTRTFAAGYSALVVPSSATVKNDGSLVETWELSASTVSGGGDWALQTTTATPPDVDEYAFQALFTSSATTLSNEPSNWSNGCPSSTTASDWNNYASIVTSSPTLYSSSLYSDPNLVGGVSGNPDYTTGPQNGNMIPFASQPGGVGIRGLCARIYMPIGTAFIGTPQVIRLTVTAAPGN